MDDALLDRFQQAYRDLDLFPLLDADSIDKFRVNYGLDIAGRLKRDIQASAGNQKFVFAGHRGCGKSTLLKRLSVELGSDYAISFFSIADMVELSDISYVKVLFAIALALLSRATKQKIAVSDDIQQTILGWYSTQYKQTESTETKGELGIGGDFLNVISARMQQEKSLRDEVERTFEKRVFELVGKMDRLAAAIQSATGQTVLVIIDDLDKLDLSRVEPIFIENIKSLFAPQFRVIFTIPVAAIREPKVMGALNSVGIRRPRLLPVAKMFAKADRRDPKAEPIQKTLDRFLQMLNKRIPAELIEPETARQMVLYSGGVVRELVRIGQESCLEQMVLLEEEPDREDKRIGSESLAIAVKNLRNDFARQLGSDAYTLLAKVYQEAETEDAADETFVELLHGLMILEYENDDLWYDVHPLVQNLMRRKGLID